MYAYISRIIVRRPSSATHTTQEGLDLAACQEIAAGSHLTNTSVKGSVNRHWNAAEGCAAADRG
jgi:hypothetical protein